MMLRELLFAARDMGASSIYIVPGAAVSCKEHGEIFPLTGDSLLAEDAENLVMQAYELAGRSIEELYQKGDDDFSFPVPGLSRFRCSAYLQRGSIAAACKKIPYELPDPDVLKIPGAVMNLASREDGLILIAGATGRGKSTTLTCMVDQINRTRAAQIMLLEDPIEYLHQHKKSLVSQREVPDDAHSFFRALRSVLRQESDVVMLGELPDTDTMRMALTASDMGKLLLAAMDTESVPETIEWIVDAFAVHQQSKVRDKISRVLRAVVVQKLIPKKDGGRIAVFEVMVVTPAIQNLIREGKTELLEEAIYGGTGQGMLSMDAELQRLFRAGVITKDTALLYAINREALAKRLF